MLRSKARKGGETEVTGKSAQELYSIGFQDAQYHQENATGQTTRQERDRTSHGAAYRQGYKQGRQERRSALNRMGLKK